MQELTAEQTEMISGGAEYFGSFWYFDDQFYADGWWAEFW